MKLTRHHYIDASFILVLLWHFVCILGAYFRVQIDDLFNDDINLIMGLQNGLQEQGFLSWSLLCSRQITTGNQNILPDQLFNFRRLYPEYLIVNWLLILGLCIYLFAIIRRGRSEQSGIHSGAGK